MVCPRCQVTFLADVEGENVDDEIAHERKFEPLPLTQRPFSQQKPSIDRVRHPKQDLPASYRFWGGIASLVLAIVAGLAIYFLIIVPSIEHERLRREEQEGMPELEEFEFETEVY